MTEYLKTGDIKEDTTAPGLNEARQKLQYQTITQRERLDYDRHIDAIMTQNDVLDTAKAEGRAEGIAIGEEAGALKEKITLTKGFKYAGTPLEVIARVTGLSVDEIDKL